MKKFMLSLTVLAISCTGTSMSTPSTTASEAENYHEVRTADTDSAKLIEAYKLIQFYSYWLEEMETHLWEHVGCELPWRDRDINFEDSVAHMRERAGVPDTLIIKLK